MLTRLLSVEGIKLKFVEVKGVEKLVKFVVVAWFGLLRIGNLRFLVN